MNSSTNYAQPDVTLALDLTGVIRRAVLANAFAKESTAEWVGRRWADTVADAKHVVRMLADARATGVAPFQELRQRFPSGLEMRFEYTAVRLGGEEGLVAIGRSLEAIAEIRERLIQGRASMERDLWRLRDVATRYKLEFDLSVEPVLLQDDSGSHDELRILEKNPVAAREVSEGLIALDPAARAALGAMLEQVREHGRAPSMALRLGGRTWLVRASSVAVEGAPAFLLRLALDPSAPVTDGRAAQRKIIEDKISAIERECLAIAARSLARKHRPPDDDKNPSGSA